MEDVRISLLQANLTWENPQANLELFEALLSPLSGQTDLIILPEMFTTGFSMAPERLAEQMDGPTMAWMAAQAAGTGAVVTGSLIIEEQGRYFNRLIWMQPDGQWAGYDKRHLFSLAGEQAHYSAGKERLVVSWKGWRICPLICYDLRFPVWSRNTDAYDMLIYVANWPTQRSHAWQSLLVARAIENQCYTIGLNRVGTDANGHVYSGDSCVIDYEGAVLARIAHLETGITLNLRAAPLQAFRKKFPFLADKDDFLLKKA